MCNVYLDYLKRYPTKIIFSFFYSLLPVIILKYANINDDIILPFSIYGVIVTISGLLVIETVNLDHKANIYKRILVNKNIEYLVHKKVKFISIVVVLYIVAMLLALGVYYYTLYENDLSYFLSILFNRSLLEKFIYMMVMIPFLVKYNVRLFMIVKSNFFKNFLRVVGSMLLLATILIDKVPIYGLSFILILIMNMVTSKRLQCYSADSYLQKINNYHSNSTEQKSYFSR